MAVPSRALLLLSVACVALPWSACSSAPEADAEPQQEASTDAGPYLGQSPPTETPVPFAPGIVSTGYAERDVTMMPDGSEIYWGLVGGSYAWTTIMVSRLVEGQWTDPEVAPCCTDPRNSDLEPHVTPDGQHFMWLSDRPGGATGEERGQDIWVMDREGDGWGQPYPLPSPVNTQDSEYFPSTTRDGTLYFTRGPAGGGENVIYRSRKVDGAYQVPERLPVEVNSGANRYNAFVDPGERFLILGVVGGEGSLGGTDYYVVFRNENDEWSMPVNLGPNVNTDGTYEYSSYVSPDGQYLFFMTVRPDWGMLAPDGDFSGRAIRMMMGEPNNGAWDIYWMDAGFLDRLKPPGF